MEKIPFIKILLVEDNPADARLLRELLAESGLKERFAIDAAGSLKEALACLCAGGFDVVLLDLMLPDTTGLDTFTALHRSYPAIPVVLLTGLSDETLAARAVREGAQDYLVKGQAAPGVLARSIVYAIERNAAERAGRAAMRAMPGERTLCPEMVGTSTALNEVKSLISTVARTSNTSVLITGETGTGKELVANAIHYSSSRKDGPLIKLNCSAIPEALMEAEMFGYEKGAFTDARQTKKGLFELADGGTIFLDEIGDMDIRLQPKLLQILENRTLRKLGGVQDMRVDVRVIAATNVDLSARVREKRFREDLFYRLNVMVIELPPLRERKEDILPIARYFMKENGSSLDGGGPGLLAPGSIDILLDHDWPGNIRELKNIIERARILAGPDDIRPAHIHLDGASQTQRLHAPGPVHAPEYPADISLEELEKAHIKRVLEKTEGNITHAARILGISRLTLREKAKKYALKEN
ncbi:MAG TPA: hypothetical protein DDW94_08955 [Deltaproteobacteria bacterium]|nr:MAG: hypothetical protein A2Z79_03460 [Deltaproteobacteria bacterium GWA2_55_82]OIJ74446.1 MAG: hypothetical protein A2V21_309360 [Deltaproteobacteria bacterium GWC2_55_46]HBG47101.1 hypothetical protein [Deltaproteobacteria bacterium]HCY10839.1 hypothetical protein [Deltaproteobacteria bacterium]